MKSQIKSNKNEQFHCYITATVRSSVRLFMFFSRQNNWKFEKRITKKTKYTHQPIQISFGQRKSLSETFGQVNSRGKKV